VAQTPSVPSPKIIPVIPPVLKSAPAASTETLAMKNTEKEKFSIEKSLLTEEAPASPHAKSVVAATREDQVTKIISSLSFKVPAQFENRLRSVIQLRLKDIRSEADTLDACARSIKDGGLGLSEVQAKELTEKSKPAAYVPKADKKEMAVREQVVDQIIAGEAKGADIAELLPTKSASKIDPATKPVSPLRAVNNAMVKNAVHDVKIKPVAMGPLDEIKYFTLVDFRRLSSNPTEAANRLKQKFVNLRDESYLLFMDSWSAWRSSPLYQAYFMVIDEALCDKRPLSAVLGERDKISMAEIEVLVNLEKDLAI
jgi:hypothetical protein